MPRSDFLIFLISFVSFGGRKKLMTTRTQKQEKNKKGKENMKGKLKRKENIV
jgi:hypothetical protein